MSSKLTSIFSKIKTKFTELQELSERKKNRKKKKLEEKQITNPRESLLLFNKKVKNFFRGYLKTETEMTYTEIAKKLREKNKPELAVFCKKMNYYLYSKEGITEENVKKLKLEYKNLRKIKKI